jgi:hypothetical protein
MLMTLTLLIGIPIFVYWVAHRRQSRNVFLATGIAFGTVVTPWSFGLYSWFFVGSLGAILGFPGLILALLHESPGFHLSIYTGLVPKGQVVDGISQRLIIETINAIVWSICYGLVGYLIDTFRSRRKNE